jgi:hypothetical protein
MSKRSRWMAVCVGCAVLLACAPEQKQISRVQTNLVDKRVFDGEWWYTSTSIDVDYDEAFVFNSANAGAPFSGSMSTDYALDYNRGGPSVLGDPSYSFPIARIRWVIDEKFLYAYRSYELVAGGNPDGRSDQFRGQPLAVFKIEDHVDVRKDYSTTTGENTNVTVENTEDRKWFEREFMRVDWSQNLLTQFAANDVQSNELFTSFKRESVPFFVQGGSHTGDLPSSYQPQFVRVKDDKDYARKNEWPAGAGDTIHYMSFVTQEVWSPGASCLYQGGGTCASVTATMRNAFLRIPTNHEYASHTETNSEFDHFGIFRSNQPTYAAGGQDRSVERKHCNADADCGLGGGCDQKQHICVGGLTADQGTTDFLSFYTSRLNFFEDSLQDKTCVEDWECDGRYTECDSNDKACLEAQSSSCDPAAHRCTTPVAQRKVRPVVFHLSPHFPAYLARQAFDAIGHWNEVLMRGRRAALSRLPFDQAPCDNASTSNVCTTDLSKQGRVPCQKDNPTGFCFCHSPDDDGGGTCKLEYDPFESPADAEKRGIPNAYDCYIQGPADVTHPTNYTDYGADAYSYTFKGDECMLKLVANSCDIDGKLPCEDLGDLRYHFITHLQHGGANFGGVAQPLSDPKNGELITTSATIAAESIENIGSLASQFFPVLRGEVSEDKYFTGDNLRGYFAAMGRVEHPVTSVQITSEGNAITDSTRPDRGEDNKTRGDNMQSRFIEAMSKAQKLKGADGRAQIKSDRLVKLQSTPMGVQLAQALASEAPDPQSNRVTQASSQLQPKLANAQQMTVTLDSAQKELEKERQRKVALGARNMDVFEDKLFNSQYWHYYADAFKDRPTAEASVRLQQAEFKGITLHEVGHVLGLRHNFAGSLDRNNYHDGYFKIAAQTPLPWFSDYDSPDKGGNGDRQVLGQEVQHYADDVRKAREERLNVGAGTVSTASIMDYNGDLSDFSGLGRYDRAAVMYSYFDRVEAYSTPDPTVDPSVAEDSIPGGLLGLERPDLYRRELWSYYRGGETCQADVDCPNHAGRETTAYQPLSQRCVPNPRLPQSGVNCGRQGACVCSNFYDDFDAYSSDTRKKPAYAPVKYLFCHDNRVGDLSWCTRSDAGESFSEVIEHYRRSWRERYPRAYFRHFSAADPAKGSSYDSVVDAVKIYQHLFFRSNFEGPEYNNSVLPLGGQDQYLASAATLDWLAEIISAPDVGSYSLDKRENIYRQVSHQTDAKGADFSLPVGQGFYLWSEYQSGQEGFFRLERAGTFLDKLLAIQALAKRDWGLTYQVDEFYYVNFYNLFEKEIVDLFGGLIMRNPKQYAPRYTDGGKLEYLSSFRNNDRRTTNQEDTYPQPAIDGIDSETLRDFATIQALSEFPVYYDTSFEQRLLVFKLGSGDGYTIPDKRADGTSTCKYGSMNCDKPDYIVYESDRLHTSYVAVVIDTDGTGKIDEQQVAYQLLLRMTQRQARIRDLQDKRGKMSLSEDESAELSRLSDDLQRDESYLEYLIELERQFGISSYFF